MANEPRIIGESAEPRTDSSRPATVRPDPGTAPTALPPESGGRDGPEPTRYGDWEKNGRCIDF